MDDFELGNCVCKVVMGKYELVVCFVSLTYFALQIWEKTENNENARKILLARIVAFPRIFIVVDYKGFVKEVRGFGWMENRAYF